MLGGYLGPYFSWASPNNSLPNCLGTLLITYKGANGIAFEYRACMNYFNPLSTHCNLIGYIENMDVPVAMTGVCPGQATNGLVRTCLKIT